MARQKRRQSPGDGSGFFYGYLIVAAAMLIMTVIWAVFYAFGVFFKPVLTEFGWTRAMTSGAFSLSALVHGLLGFVIGGLTDKFGPRLVITFCGLLLGCGYFLMSQISAVWQFYLFYGVIIGAGMGGSFIPFMTTVVRWFSKRRGAMSGIVAAGTGIGALIGPPVASRLIVTYGWRISYALMGCVVLAVTVIAAQLLKRDPAQVGQVIDGGNQGEQRGLYSGDEGVSLREAVYTGKFWAFFTTGFCLGYCVFAIMVHIAPHATEVGMTTTRAANILATIGGMCIVGKLVMGRVADRIGSRLTLMIGFILISWALFWMVPTKMAWILYVIAVIFGLGYGACAVSQSPLLADLFGLRFHGSIFGTFSISINSGAAISPLLTGYIFDVTGSYRLAFLICACIGFAGIISTAALKQKRVDV